MGYNPRLKVLFEFCQQKNKYSFLTTVNLFNAKTKVSKFQSLTTWDNGNQLTYPVKYIDAGYKDQNNDDQDIDEAKSTGFEVIRQEVLCHTNLA